MSVPKRIWDIWIILFTLFLSIEIPLRFSILDYPKPLNLWMEWGITFFFGIDMILNFISPIQEHDQWITDKKKITRKYLSSWFIPDLIATIPFTLISESLFGNSRVFRLAHLFHINRLLKLTHIQYLTQRWQLSYKIKPGLIRLILFIFGIGIFSHWAACGWILLNGVERQADGLTVYLDALYWSITTLSTVGYGDVVPVNLPQKIYTMLIMIMGVGSYGYVIGNVANLLANVDLVRSQHVQKMEEISSFLRHRKVANPLKKKILDYYFHLWDHRMDTREEIILKELPHEIRTELWVNLYQDLIQKVSYFKDASPVFIREIVFHLSPMMLSPGMMLMSRGERSDRMYFISSGEVEILAEDEQTVITTLVPGDLLGESILERGHIPSARAKTYVDLYFLEKEQLDLIVSKYPEFKHHLNQQGLE